MSQRKVLVILPSYDAGGAENYALRLIEYAGTEDYEWHVTTGNPNNRGMEPNFEAAGAAVHTASPGFGLTPRVISFWRFLRRHRFDAVMSLNGVFAGVPMALARLSGMPVRVAWHRRSTPAYAQTPGRRAYARLGLALLNWGSTRILSNSEAALDTFHGGGWRSSEKFAVIPNGVDAERFRPRPADRPAIRKQLGLADTHFVVGHVGRVDPAKDHETLFRIVRALHDDDPNVRLLIVGTGTDTPAMQARLAAYGIADITYAMGVRDDVEMLYQAMDVFVFPSVTEGQPNALIEAMLSGVPVVASDIAPIRKVLPVEYSSQCFAPKDVQAACQQVNAAAEVVAETSVSARRRCQTVFDIEQNLERALTPLRIPSESI
ncbi:UNVERIFIED_CONTAM: glycosyltransferase [Spiribacter pallidus]